MLGMTFENSSAEPEKPEKLQEEEYYNLLRKLLGQGEGFGKARNVGGYLLRNLHLVTTTNSDVDETSREINVDPLYLVMDLDEYPNEYVRKLVIRDTMSKYASRILHEDNLNDPDFRGPGLWTAKKNSFEFDYLPGDDPRSGIFRPNPEAYRVCLQTDTDITIPVPWGEFTIESGGTLAIRERDVAELSNALEKIESGEMTISEALYVKNKDDGEYVSRFDMYGMMPDFLENNYDPVDLKPETIILMNRFKDTDGQDSAPEPSGP